MRRRWGRIVAAVLLFWLIAVAISTAVGYQQARQAQQVLAGLRTVDRATVTDPATVLELRRASTLLSNSHGALANPLMQPLRLLPIAGRQLSSAIALTGAGQTITAVAADGLEEVPAVAFAANRGDALQKVAEVAAEADRQLQGVELGPEQGLAGPLFDARAQAADVLRIMRDASSRGGAAAEALASLYQRDGRYLIVVANNGEMRAGSGMWLSAGVLNTGADGLRLGEIRTVGSLPEHLPGQAWPPEYEALWGWLGEREDLRNLMLSPRFDQSAPLAKEIWEKAGGAPVDGVLVIDPVFLQALLPATGPVQVGDQRFTADNVLSELLVDQYRGITVGGSTVESQVARRDVLRTVATRVFDALSGSSVDPVRLLTAMEQSSAGRHVMAWAADEKVNVAWQRAGVGGQLSENSLMLSSSNVGANKLDQFLDTDVALTTAVEGDVRRHRLEITVTNETPEDLPFYVTGPTAGTGLMKGQYHGLLTLNLPADATDVTLAGGEQIVAEGTDGPTQVIAASVKIKDGETVKLVAEFKRPRGSVRLVVEPSARVPSTTWTFGPLEFDDSRAQSLLF